MAVLIVTLLTACGGESTSSDAGVVTTVTTPGSSSSTTPAPDPGPAPIDPNTVVRSGLKEPENDAPTATASLVTETDEVGIGLRTRLWLKKRGW